MPVYLHVRPVERVDRILPVVAIRRAVDAAVAEVVALALPVDAVVLEEVEDARHLRERREKREC